ncbi:hypothetical protein E2562_001830 [Oryza meyeriana var. granulata]|uniref:Uncharacterized protein n=1 Tax=Oryza meyeriana var. granulata TaxID=110450 RepID=A0A6G1CDF8_9ORYZ|nr:hypothetical protein E2562_001830 [Oryza meyeriana var. granulata]
MAMAFPQPGLMELVADPARLPVALITLGAVQSAAGFSLILSRAPGGIFLRLHGSAPRYLYYGILSAVVIFGLAEMSFGYWVAPRDLDGWRAIAKTMLWVSILFLVLVAALGGLVLLK